ncbi:MAG: thiol reductant ABC exporter subunit CydD [Bacillota bacterium]|nr:thiol reductant ABC exporter subunit CydD [Bacillota bacterium]
MINKRLLKESVRKASYVPAGILNSLLSAVFTIFNALLLALVVDRVFIRGESLKSIILYIVLFIINSACRFAVGLALETHIRSCAEEIKEEIKDKSFKIILSSTPDKIKGQKNGDIISLLTEGTEMLTAYYSQYIPQFFSAILIPMVLLICSLFVDRLSALIMLITYPLIPLFMILIGSRSKELNERQWKKLTLLSSHFLDMLQGIRTLKVFGRSRLQEEKVFQVSEEYRHSTIQVLRVSFLSALVLEAASTICTAVVAVNLGLRLTYGKISFFNAFFILMLTPDFYMPMRQLGTRFHASLNGNIAIEKIDELHSSLVDRTDTRIELQQVKAHVSIQFRKLSFHREERETLKDISFSINSKEKVALIGESGSGKSTLINILSGFIRADDERVFINGSDLNGININSYMEKVSLVPQFPHIFNMSIRENILLGNDIPEEEFLNICSLTRVDDFLRQFPEGYETLIGDGEAVVLSGGEKQRLALARALVKKPEFIIMDEPTSSLDAETEEIVPGLLTGELRDKTVLIASHRLNIIKEADKILVLHDGSIAEMGTHEELLKLGGRYYNMVKAMEGRL